MPRREKGLGKHSVQKVVIISLLTNTGNRGILATWNSLLELKMPGSQLIEIFFLENFSPTKNILRQIPRCQRSLSYPWSNKLDTRYVAAGYPIIFVKIARIILDGLRLTPKGLFNFGNRDGAAFRGKKPPHKACVKVRSWLVRDTLKLVYSLVILIQKHFSSSRIRDPSINQVHDCFTIVLSHESFSFYLQASNWLMW